MPASATSISIASRSRKRCWSPGSGGSTGGGGDGSSGGGGSGSQGGTGSSSSSGSSSTSSGRIDPDAPKLGPDGPVDPQDAAAAGIATVAALAGAGIINAAEAGKAIEAIRNGAVPEEVIATLTKGKDVSPLFPGISDLVHLPPTPEQNLTNARDKLAKSGSGTHPTFTAGEYVEWVKDLERRFPGASRGTIIAAIHAGRYLDVGDVNGYVPKTQVRLFEQGKESDGWEDINRTFVGANPDYIDGQKIPPYVSKTPWYVTDHSGRLIDINHAMAGVRNDVNRPAGWKQVQWFGPPPEAMNVPGHPGVAVGVTFDRDTLRWINTDGGDSFQVATNGMTGKLGYYPEWAPPDQRLGNAAGIWMGNYLRDPAHAGASMSQALEAYLETTRPAGR